MIIYESAKKYAEELNMSPDQAKIRVEHFLNVKKEMDESRKCPKCHKYTLDFEGGEWEMGIPAWIYCENDEIESVDEDGDKYFDECDFTDDVHDKYLFAFHEDFDVVLAMSCSVDINDEQAVQNFIGSTWSEFVEKDTARLNKKQSIQ